MAAPLQNPAARRKRLFRWFAEGLVLLLVLYLLHLWQTRDAIEGQAPPLSGRFMTGEAFSLEAPRDQPLLIYFWASWCPVCGLSSSSVDKLTKHHSVVTVAMQSGDERELTKYLQTQSLGFPVISDPQSRIANAWGVKGVPTVYVLDTQGNIRFVSVGYTTLLGLKARLWLAE
ncbi:MAG: protein disulfide oxidoreductase [Candidatus Thiodiazotropha sp. (ex Myrtea spinifera)]|nr:protein disulfide oxidoreductase [Candidatus Thiodiazotropha sp. (ex Myrtea spinifera)]